jgi:hypothetical protein
LDVRVRFDTAANKTTALIGRRNMAEAQEAKMEATLGLTGVTVNAMALIAPARSSGSPS